MCDKLVFDLSQEIEGSPNVFVRKDWINILDNQNQNYNNNQSVIDTSQLSNSNKYMSYREAYFSIPFIITLATIGTPTLNAGSAGTIPTAISVIDPTTDAKALDSAVGLKNWFGQIIHSFTVDYNGTTIIQQTPYVNMWNSFKLMTSFSYGDIITQGATIGFYPDDPLAFQFNQPKAVTATASNLASGNGVCNNTNFIDTTTASNNLTKFNTFSSGLGNEGFLQRQKNIFFDSLSNIGTTTGASGDTYGNLLFTGASATTGLTSTFNQIWKSYIYNKQIQTASNSAIVQTAVVATVYLKHIHSFFNMCPLLKGVFMKMTLNLNNTTTSFVAQAYSVGAGSGAITFIPSSLNAKTVNNPLGGVNPIMIASGKPNNGGVNLFVTGATGAGAGALYLDQEYRVNLSVGSVCLDSTLKALTGYVEAPLSKSINLYIPAYTFNPVFEQAYLSSPVKQIKYSDIYQYQVLNIGSGQNFNNLLTNGIANIKSVLLLPFYSATGGANTSTGPIGANTLNSNTGFIGGVPVWQSPFDPAGTGPTSPLIPISNFNIQVSGQNAIYNMEKYSFEQFNNQLYGQNAVNGGLTDGLTSGLIDRNGFDMEYCYYYVNVERMLPVDLSVPKSIQILGQNLSAKAIDIISFVEYGCEISIDVLTGARV